MHKAFASLRTHNMLSVKPSLILPCTAAHRTPEQVDINHVADWWLGDIKSPYFSALANCIEDEWKIKPLLIREGGSIPSLPFLEREFAAASVHFPMGQGSDSAHLPDEKIRIINLEVRSIWSLCGGLELIVCTTARQEHHLKMALRSPQSAAGRTQPLKALLLHFCQDPIFGTFRTIPCRLDIPDPRSHSSHLRLSRHAFLSSGHSF